MTKKAELKILTINLDYTLAMEAPEFGDAQQRNIDYGRYVEKIISITHSPRCLNLKYRKLSDEVEIFPTSSDRPIFFLFDALRLAKRIFSQHKIDVVLSQDPFITGLVGYLIKRKYGPAFLIHFHGDFWQNKFWLKEKWYNFLLLWLSRFLVKRADGIRVVSSGIKRKLIKEGVPAQKIRVIPTPVDLKKFANYDQNKVKELREQHQNRKTILNIGRYDPAKDYTTLCRAISLVYEKCRNLAFWQIGAGERLCKKIKADDNLVLSFSDKVQQQELINCYHASDIYVSSSLHESLGKVLIEAMACGLPVVATATTGSKEIVRNGKTGFLVLVGNSQALAKKILYLLNNPETAKQMGEAGRKLVQEKFNREKIIKKTINFWQDLAAR